MVGAGPAGLQLGYYMQQANRNYVIFERANISGLYTYLYIDIDFCYSLFSYVGNIID